MRVFRLRTTKEYYTKNHVAGIWYLQLITDTRFRTLPGENHYALEAWELMTTGGARVRDYAPFLTLHIDWIERRAAH